MLYFAYGSNMLFEQLQKRCPSAQFVCIATAEGRCLAFTHTAMAKDSKWQGCGVADLVDAAQERAWGGVFQIAENEVPFLDKCEGYSPGRTKNAYCRQSCVVCEDGDPTKVRDVQIYLVSERESPHPLPHKEYVKRILNGAKEIKLPQSYIEKLEAITTRE